MASITKRAGKWRAQVRRKGHATESKTFSTKAAAMAWATQREADIERGGVPRQLGDVTIGDVLDAYRRMRDNARPISDSSTEHYMLKALRAGLGHLRMDRASPQDLVNYAAARKEDGAGPYTVNMEVSKLGTALRYGAASLRISPPDIVGAARPLLSHLRLIGGGGKRERRPTEDEIERILAHLAEQYGRIYAEAVEFAIHSAMRRGEVCDLKWADIDELTRLATVARKHPRLGKSVEKVPLLPAAWAVLQRQPREDERVFPVHPSTLSKYFTWSCQALSIPDLHLHDMRHEGVSRLFEDGLRIEQVALVSGHRDWRNLRRYTQLKPESLTSHQRSPAPPSRPGDAPPPDSPPSASPGPGTS